MTTWHRERKARNGKQRIPEIKEVFDHYRTVCRRATKTGGWIDFDIDGAHLRRIFEQTAGDERPVVAWLIKEFIDQHFSGTVAEKSKTKLAYVLWKYEEEVAERGRPPVARRIA